MALRSNRFSADPVLEQCAAGTHRMFKPEENLSVLRAHNVEPFVGLQLHEFLGAPVDSQRHDVGKFMLDALRLGDLLGIIAKGRALGMTDPRIPLADKQFLATMRPDASGVTHRFVDAAGVPYTVIGLNDLLIRVGCCSPTTRPTGRRTTLPRCSGLGRRVRAEPQSAQARW